MIPGLTIECPLFTITVESLTWSINKLRVVRKNEEIEKHETKDGGQILMKHFGRIIDLLHEKSLDELRLL